MVGTVEWTERDRAGQCWELGLPSGPGRAVGSRPKSASKLEMWAAIDLIRPTNHLFRGGQLLAGPGRAGGPGACRGGTRRAVPESE